MIYKSPYPYFGGKSKVAARVWERLGNPANYVEPFFGTARRHEREAADPQRAAEIRARRTAEQRVRRIRRAWHSAD